MSVLPVDDQAAIREALALAFGQDDEFIVAGEAGSLAEARGLLDGVNVVILDHELPDGDGADLVEDLHDRDPRIQTLVISAHADRASVERAVQMGAAAVLGKTTHLHNVVSGVRRARAGETLSGWTRPSTFCASPVACASASWTNAGAFDELRLAGAGAP